MRVAEIMQEVYTVSDKYRKYALIY